MKNTTDLSTLITTKLEQLHIPGAAVGLLHNGQIFTAGFGLTSVTNPLPVTADTLFQIGSITKTMTATLMMILAQDGRLDFTAPIRTYLPNFRVQDETVSQNATVKDLLTHSAGWVGDHFINTGAGADAKAKYVASMAKLPQLAPPATAFSYNNAAFGVAGRIIETVTGQLFEEAMRDLLFKPLGMDNSFFDMADIMVRRFVVGHRHTDGQNEVATPWPLPRASFAAGAVTSTVGDLLTYAQFYLNDGQTADATHHLPANAIQTLWTPQFPISGESASIGYSWFIRQEDGRTTYGHGGATTEQYANLKIVPEHNFVLITFTNGTNGRIFNREIEQFILQTYCNITPSHPQTLTPTTAQLTELTGRYTRPMLDIELQTEDNQLMLRVIPKQGFPSENDPPRPPSPYCPITLHPNNTFTVTDGPLRGSDGQIIRHENGRIRWIRFGLRLHAAGA